MIDKNLEEVTSRHYVIRPTPPKQGGLSLLVVSILALTLVLYIVRLATAPLPDRVYPTATVVASATIDQGYAYQIAEEVFRRFWTATATVTPIAPTETISAEDSYMLSLPYCIDLTPSTTPQACMPYDPRSPTPRPTDLPRPTDTPTEVGICVPESYSKIPDPCILVIMPTEWVATLTPTRVGEFN